MSCAALPVFLLMLALPFCQDTPAAPPAQPETATGEPQAKTQAELDAYAAAVNDQDLAAAEDKVAAFVAAHPESELRASAYAALMQRHQQARDLDKSIALGRQALEYDTNHVIALVVTASNLVDTAEKASDSAARFSEADRYADRAIAQIESGAHIAATSSSEQLEALKSSLLTGAHTAKGLAASKRKDYAGAETDLKRALQHARTKPDPSLYFHLAIAQDHLSKYSDALDSVNQAIALADAQKNNALAAAARSHKERLTQLVARAPKSKAKTKSR